MKARFYGVDGQLVIKAETPFEAKVIIELERELLFRRNAEPLPSAIEMLKGKDKSKRGRR